VLARHPLLYWIVVAVCAGVAAHVVAGAVREVDRERSRWGDTSEVWVAAHAVVPGEAIAAELRTLPLALMPDGVVERDPVGAVALQRLAAGEIVTTADVGGGALELLPQSWQGVAFAADDTTIRLRIGDRVGVVADGVVVVESAVVIDVAERSVTVGVPSADAASAALAARAQTAALTLRRP
jgi:hypothetical protein